MNKFFVIFFIVRIYIVIFFVKIKNAILIFFSYQYQSFNLLFYVLI